MASNQLSLQISNESDSATMFMSNGTPIVKNQGTENVGINVKEQLIKKKFGDLLGLFDLKYSKLTKRKLEK